MKHYVCLIVLSLVSVGSVFAVTAPYSNDFSGTGSNTAFTSENTDAEWTVSGGAYQWNYTNTSYAASSASLPVTGMTGLNFTVQTQFTVNSTGNVNSNGATVGFGLFGNDAAFTGTGGSNSYYLADFQYARPSAPGNLRIIALGDTSGTSNTAVTVDANLADASLAVELGTTYTLRLTGTYTGSTLNMTLGLFDVTGTTQIGTSATATDTSVLTGTNFGYRNRVGISGGTASTTFDNFSISTTTIPEPSTAVALVGVGALAAVLGVRRGMRN